MGEITVEDKAVAVPGELLAKGMDCIPSYGTYREGENVYSSRLGLVNVSGKVIKIIPLTGVYNPKRGDTIIGRVIDVLVSGWRVELNSAYSGMLSLKDGTSEFVARGADLTKYYNLGDYIMVSVSNVTSQKLVDLSMRGPGLRKLSGGQILKVNPNKVPRVIGKHGSMVSMIKNATNSKILVGQNGLIWLNAEPKDEVIARNAINMIAENSHISGLTEKVKSFLEEVTGKKVEIVERPENEGNDDNGENSHDNSHGNNHGERNYDRPRRNFDRNSDRPGNRNR
ncbi:RNA-binding protein [Candidatus Woesearchaeota archaeon]|nr:RNA-binding protein [Candidatus Woesearchaeota archaeon]